MHQLIDYLHVNFDFSFWYCLDREANFARLEHTVHSSELFQVDGDVSLQGAGNLDFDFQLSWHPID